MLMLEPANEQICRWMKIYWKKYSGKNAGMKITYTRLINNSLVLYMDGKYKEAYRYITKNYYAVKGNDAQIYNFRYSFACKAGMADLGMALFREAIVDKGYWYSFDYLISDDDLAPLHDYADFTKLIMVCKQREIDAQKASSPELKRVNFNLGKASSKPVLMALHGNEENITLTESYYSAALEAGYSLAFPRSSQIVFSDAYSWLDIEKGSKEIMDHTDSIEGDVILSGFSAGGRVSLLQLWKNSSD